MCSLGFPYFLPLHCMLTRRVRQVRFFDIVSKKKLILILIKLGFHEQCLDAFICPNIPWLFVSTGRDEYVHWTVNSGTVCCRKRRESIA